MRGRAAGRCSIVDAVPAWRLSRYFRLVAIGVVACTAIAATLALTKEPAYEAGTQFFVSTSGAGKDVGDAYRGELFSQQRVASYAEIVSSTELLRAVARQLRLPGGMRELQGNLRASVPPDTVLIDVTARDESPAQAKAIAAAVGRQLPRFVAALETPRDASTSPVRVTLTREPELPLSAVSPDMKLYLALGLLAGLALGIGGAAVSAAFDDRVRSIEAIEQIVGAPVVGSVADDAGGRGSLVLLDDPLSGRAEDYRQTRTHLHARSTISSLVVASAAGHDGTTSIAANLGVAFAHGGQRVALVDANLRASRLSELFGLRSRVGLTDVLAGDVPLEKALMRPADLPLAVVAAGTPEPHPSDSLASPRLPGVIAALREYADVVIVDAPSFEHGSDASALAAAASATLLVARLHSTRAAQLESAAQAIGLASGPVLGVVVNRRPRRRWTRRATSGASVRGPAVRQTTDDADPRSDAASHPQVASGRRA
jgi:capsular exopolysaccharide synthesis family protein